MMKFDLSDSWLKGLSIPFNAAGSSDILGGDLDIGLPGSFGETASHP